jgi:nitrite reductase (NO-forming)
MKHLREIIMAGCLSGAGIVSVAQSGKADLKESMVRGKELYAAQCIACHMENGEGLEGVYPPLARADYMMADKKRSIQQVLKGVEGEMVVNKVTYNSFMTSFEILTDQEIADILNYVRNSWGNKGAPVTRDEVKALR